MMCNLFYKPVSNKFIDTKTLEVYVDGQKMNTVVSTCFTYLHTCIM